MRKKQGNVVGINAIFSARVFRERERRELNMDNEMDRDRLSKKEESTLKIMIISKIPTYFSYLHST